MSSDEPMSDVTAVHTRLLTRLPDRGDIVELNVGGQTFTTTRDTLGKFPYFKSILEESFGSATDDQGR